MVWYWEEVIPCLACHGTEPRAAIGDAAAPVAADGELIVTVRAKTKLKICRKNATIKISVGIAGKTIGSKFVDSCIALKEWVSL